MSEAKVEMIRKFFQRTRDISNHGMALTAGLAKFNIMAIAKLGNASAPLHAKLPEEKIRVIKELIINGPKDIAG